MDIPTTKAKFRQTRNSQTIHVSDRASDSNRETGVVRSPSHATHSVASEASLACSRESGNGHSFAPFSPSTSGLVAKREQCSSEPTVISPSTRSTNSNEGWGAHLGDSTARGVWSDPESRLHINFLELKAVFLALKSFQHLCRDKIVLIATDNTTVVSYCGALLWRLVSPQRNSSVGSVHSRSLECDSRQAVQAQSGDPDRVVPISAGI